MHVYYKNLKSKDTQKGEKQENKNHYFGAFSPVFFCIYTCTHLDHTTYIITSFSVKGQTVNVFSFAGHMVSVNSATAVVKGIGEAVFQ